MHALGKLPNLAETNPYATTAVIINTGSGTRTNVPVSLNITGATTFNTTATIASISSGDTAYVTFPPYSTTAVGTNTLTVTVPADDDPSNNSNTCTQVVTTGQISHAQGNPPVHTTTLSPMGANGTLLAKFKVKGPVNANAPVKVPSVDIMIGSDAVSVNKVVYAVLFDSAGTQIGRSPDYIIQNYDLSTMKTFDITTPPSLTTGEFYAGLAVVSFTRTFYPLGAQQEVFARPNTFYTSPLSGGMPTPVKNKFLPIIQPLLFKCTNPVTPTLVAGGFASICTGGSVNLTATTSTTGVTFKWYLNGSLISGATGGTYTANQIGTYTVEAISGFCNSTTSNPVTISNGTPAIPTITAAGPTTFCQGGSVTLTGATTTTGVTYQWFKNGSPIAGGNKRNL